MRNRAERRAAEKLDRQRRPASHIGGHDRCSAECPRCRVHAGDEGGPEVSGLTAKGETQVKAGLEAGLPEFDIEVNLFCPDCQIAWVGILEGVA